MCSVLLQAASLRMPIDDRVKAHIRQMVNDGINNVAEARRHTEAYVKGDLFAVNSLLSHLNQRYYSISRAARVTRMHSHVDQEQLQARISKWQQLYPDNKFFCRPYTETQAVDVSSDIDDNDDDDTDVSLCASCRDGGLLVIYQSQWQRRLLAQYFR